MVSCGADNGTDMKRKKQPQGLTNCGTGANKMKQNKTGQIIKSSGHAGTSTPKESTPREAKEVSRPVVVFSLRFVATLA
jgi:transcription initiation factor TFIID subunit 1